MNNDLIIKDIMNKVKDLIPTDDLPVFNEMVDEFPGMELVQAVIDMQEAENQVVGTYPFYNLPDLSDEEFDNDDDDNDYEHNLALAEAIGTVKVPGLSIDEIESLPESKFHPLGKPNMGTDQTCTICVESYKVRQNLRTLPCKHTFHRICADMWLYRDGSCPVCREKAIK